MVLPDVVLHSHTDFELLLTVAMASAVAVGLGGKYYLKHVRGVEYDYERYRVGIAIGLVVWVASDRVLPALGYHHENLALVSLFGLLVVLVSVLVWLDRWADPHVDAA